VDEPNPAPEAPPVEADPQPPAAPDPQRILDDLKRQSEERLSLQRTTHDLIVDLSIQVKQIADEGSSRQWRAVLQELVLLQDSLEQVLQWAGGPGEAPSREAIADRLETLRIELLEILLRRDVRPFDGTSDVLDRHLHRTVKTVPTDDPALNDRVKTVVRPGYHWREQVLRPEEVIIFKYKPQPLEES